MERILSALVPSTAEWLRLVFAAVATFPLGGIWYGPLFGSVFIRLAFGSREAFQERVRKAHESKELYANLRSFFLFSNAFFSHPCAHRWFLIFTVLFGLSVSTTPELVFSDPLSSYVFCRNVNPYLAALAGLVVLAYVLTVLFSVLNVRTVQDAVALAFIVSLPMLASSLIHGLWRTMDVIVRNLAHR